LLRQHGRTTGRTPSDGTPPAALRGDLQSPLHGRDRDLRQPAQLSPTWPATRCSTPPSSTATDNSVARSVRLGADGVPLAAWNQQQLGPSLASSIATLPTPVANADSKPYWDAARERRLVIRKCKACSQLHFMPRTCAPTAGPTSSNGWMPRAPAACTASPSSAAPPIPAFAPLVPYAVALIDLDEGPRMMANIVGRECAGREDRRPGAGDLRGPRRRRHAAAVHARRGLRRNRE
jgi:uncharacterized OB-fold protein